MKRSIRQRISAICCASIMLTGLCSILPAGAAGENLITNSTFDAGIDDWSMYYRTGADAEIFASDGMLAMTVRELGTLNYAVQLSSNAMTLTEGAYYQLTFDIYSTADRYIDAIVQENGGSYTAFAAKGINITGEVRTVTVPFRMEEATSEAKLVFNCGNHNEILPEHTIYIDNVVLTEVDESEVETYDPYEPPILINQVGYLPDAKKTAVFRDITDETTFSVVNADTKKIVLTGELYGRMENTAADEVNWYGDFSAVQDAGTYYITCGDLDPSYSFTVSGNVYADLLDNAVRMLYLQRCGCAVEDDVFGHPACHTADSVLSDSGETINVTGGWHDAGDYGRYVVPAAKTIADLFLAYDANPAIHSDSIGIPESGNGIPDILDEARYAIAWMLKMQTASGGVYHKVTAVTDTGSVMPEKETAAQTITPVTTTATADFCAIMAMAYEYYQGIDPAFAEECLDAAKLAWDFLQANPDMICDREAQSGVYTDSTDGDERYWACCQMYRATGDTAYLDAMENITIKYYKDGLEWHMVGHYGNIALLTLDGMDKNSPHYLKAKEMLHNWVNEYTSTSAETGYQTAIDRFTWGSNMSVANSGIVLALASRLDDDTACMDTARLQLDYILGRNPNGMCYVTGEGTASPQNPHHRPSIVKDEAMPGMLVGGVNSDLADPVAERYLADAPPAKRYVDMMGSYTTNEITTYWNSPLIYLLSLIQEAPESVRGDVDADGDLDVLDIIMLQKWLLNAGTITDWQAGDLNADQVLDGFDLAMLKRMYLE